MNFLNLGLPEIIFIILIALIIFGPDSMVKSAKDAGSLIKKVAKSSYWQEIWATKRDLEDLPKIIAKETQLDESIQSLQRDSRNLTGSVSSAVSDLIKEVNTPVEDKTGPQISENRIKPPKEPTDQSDLDINTKDKP